MRTEINSQLRNLTLLLVRYGFSIHQNWPVYNSDQNMIVWTNYKNLAFVLKDEPYIRLYDECRKNADYNFLLIDGALIQMKYAFDNNSNLNGHILLYYPHYDFMQYEDLPTEFENRFYGQELFGDIFESRNVTFPLRIDYSSEHRDVIHPRVHATLGNCQTCRIPVAKPISPVNFISFILRNFYSTKFVETNIENDLKDEIVFGELITPNEKKLIHFNFEFQSDINSKQISSQMSNGQNKPVKRKNSKK